MCRRLSSVFDYIIYMSEEEDSKLSVGSCLQCSLIILHVWVWVETDRFFFCLTLRTCLVISHSKISSSLFFFIFNLWEQIFMNKGLNERDSIPRSHIYLQDSFRFHLQEFFFLFCVCSWFWLTDRKLGRLICIKI